MNLPRPGDYIDIHSHGSKPSEGIFIIENLMAHEKITPADIPEKACSFGIHPWYLEDNNSDQLLNNVRSVTRFHNLFAIGEAGFDKLRGPSMGLQQKVFEAQAVIAEENRKPLVIHCVRAWDELLQSHKRLKPEMPWLIHGFRGKRQLAEQLISKGMYLSFWFDFVLRQESTDLLRSLSPGRFFFETDGADVDIRDIYKKVSDDLDLSLDELKATIIFNFNVFFNFTQ